MTISREKLMAYADGELERDDAAAVEAALAGDPDLAQQVSAHRKLRQRISTHFAPILDDTIPRQLADLIKPSADLIDFSAAKGRRDRPRWVPNWYSGSAIAASLALGVLLGTQVQTRDGVTGTEAALYASGDLADALDARLASNEDGVSIQMLVSFRDKSGTICRAFDGKELSGIACRDDERWKLRLTHASSGGNEGEYRQAGSSDTEILAAAQDMLMGDPFDAETERLARANGWK